MDMKVRRPPTPEPDAPNAHAETLPSRDPTHPISRVRRERRIGRTNGASRAPSPPSVRSSARSRRTHRPCPPAPRAFPAPQPRAPPRPIGRYAVQGDGGTVRRRHELGGGVHGGTRGDVPRQRRRRRHRGNRRARPERREEGGQDRHERREVRPETRHPAVPLSLFFFAPVPSPRISPPSHAPSLLSAQPRRHPSRPRLPRARRGRVGRFRRREGERDRERAVPPVPGRRRRSGAHGALEPLPGFATRARPRSRVAHRTRRRARLAFVPA